MVLDLNGKLFRQMKANRASTIKERQEDMKIKRIFTKKMAVYLRERGFKILGTEVNRKHPEFDVYLFEDTETLIAAMLDYSNKFCSD